ncbi:glycogen debranching protein [Streptomyces sp. AHA2]
MPFSIRGAWINLSRVTGIHVTKPDVHVVTHTTGMHGVLAIIPTLRGERVEASVSGSSSMLTWSHGERQLEATFESPDTIRLRGRGLGVRIEDGAPGLTSFTGAYLFRQPADNAPVFTSYESGRRYRVTTISGSANVTGAECLGVADRWVEFHEADEWEVAIEEIKTGRRLYKPTRTFDECARRIETEFTRYLDDIAPWRTSEFPGVARAAYVMWSATVAPAGELRRESMLMSKHWMDHVWSWDHCFNALALLPAGLTPALEQFTLPFDFQDETGALPDSVGHNVLLHNYVKPPIHGWCLRRLRELSPHPIPRDELLAIYEGLSRWTTFWLDHRRVPGRAVPYYEHGNDSGWDNSTIFDLDRVIEAPDLAAFLIVQLDVLAECAAELGVEDRWSAERDRMLAAVVDDHWTGEAFVARSAHTGRDSTATSLLNVMPVFIADRLPKEIADRLAAQAEQFLTEWGPATELVTSEHYEPDGYWRGPIWAPSTALIEDGLRRAGYTELADTINARFRRLCETSGFAENFDALTGRGLRDRAYTWTASVYLSFAAETVRRSRAD